MDDTEILEKIHGLVDQERQLRRQRQHHELDASTERDRLQQLEQTLDQCWDLLRQRRAREEFGQSLSGTGVRPIEEIENYRQ